MMKLTTLCYVEHEGCWLMLHRVKKQKDENEGKWIGIGGHLEAGETPEECIRREALEETGLSLKNLKLRGILTFILPKWGNELTFLYTAETDSSDLKENDEGILQWVPQEMVDQLELWPGDRAFLPLLKEKRECFSMKLVYDEEDRLLETKLQ